MDVAVPETLLKTPLDALHRALGAKMVPFAGYDMPVQYPAGILKEHLHTREGAGLFDVSHMGQRVLTGPDYETVARALEAMTPGDFLGLAPGRQRYSMLLNDKGGIVDDLMATRPKENPDTLVLVVNAGRKDVDDVFIRDRLPNGVALTVNDRALLALQGPKAESVLARHGTGVSEMSFMAAKWVSFAGIDCFVSRSGYTGEDGFEISVPSDTVEQFARTLIAEPEVLPIGLGARDSLRLEAGLCLYGHDIDENTTPIEAGLAWTIAKRRKARPDFPGGAAIMEQLLHGSPRKRVGIRPRDKAPAREGTEIVASGRVVGHVTSGGFAPTLNAPIAMGYVETAFGDDGKEVALMVRGTARAAGIVPLPFVPHRYKRG